MEDENLNEEQRQILKRSSQTPLLMKKAQKIKKLKKQVKQKGAFPLENLKM